MPPRTPVRRASAPPALLRLALGIALACVPAVVGAQATASVAGTVTGATGEPVPGAGVSAEPAGGRVARRASTDSAGAYLLRALAPGRYVVRASRIGFAPVQREVVLAAGQQARVDLRLADSSFVIEAVEVRADRGRERERNRFQTEAGVTTRIIGGTELKLLPGLGEPDVLRAVELLPGVVSTSDFSSAYNVHGGSADENLILLDGFPIFNPFHLGGLFSVFNSDLVSQAELLSGGFGAEYGGRVSSVLNVETKPTAEPGLHGEAGVSVLASRLALHSQLPAGVSRALGGDNGSWFASARRSYFDVLLKPVTAFPYHLTDLQGGMTIGTRGGGRVRVTGYTGRDALDLSDFQPDEGKSVLRVRWDWGNDVAGIAWNQPVGSRWVADTRLGWSRYAEELGFTDFGDTRFASSIRQLTARGDVGGQLSPTLTLRTGLEASRTSYDNDAVSGGTTFFGSRNAGTLASAYGQVRWHPGRWIVEPGLRADSWRARDGTRSVLSPRVAVKRFLGAEREAAIKLSAGRYAQFVHSLRDEQLPISNDTWVTAGRDVPPTISDQAHLGAEKYWAQRWYASAEGYYHRFRGVTDFNEADDPNTSADDVLAGTGRSYGLDLMVRRSAGRVTGWTTVSLLRARRTFPDPGAQGIEGVPQTVTFAPVYDRRVSVNVVLESHLGHGIDAGARWNFGSGTPYSRPVGDVVVWETNLFGGGYRT
ncbi:MAG TPA: TonB-dependent receptor, partial [Longimicrobiaceae bacterium]|nr:TonB-dependent receptor [Longimicrobiaceae bacterium]